MTTESFDHISGDILVAMFHSASKYCEEERTDITSMGMCRPAHLGGDVHVGLPHPQVGDFIFEGDVEGLRREFLVRDYRIVWSRPKNWQEG